MIIKTIQWNIGGAKIRDKDSNPIEPSSYCIDDLDYIADVIKKHNPGIITLQEIHSGNLDQAKKLSEILDMPYFIKDIYAKSHLEEGQDLGQAIISRYPIEKHNFELFKNPKYELVQIDGNKWISHDKGVTSADIVVNQTRIEVETLHLIPFRKFGVDPLSINAKEIRIDINNKIKSSASRFLLQGDFNFDNQSIKELIPNVFDDETDEVLQNEVTTPKGRKYDHIIYKGIELVSSKVSFDVLTDHYPIISEFKLRT